MTVRILLGDCRDVLRTLADGSVQCVVTSPPYFGLRDYGVDRQIGLEETPAAYVSEMVAVFREVRRVLRDDGTLWLNLGDSYNAGRDGGHAGGAKQADLPRHAGIQRSGANVPGIKPKDLIGIPWMVAFALRADGWWLRQDNIWAKRNCMPESVSGSQYVRHRIKIGDYEKLFGVPYPGECDSDARPRDLSGMQAGEISDRETTLPTEPSWEGNRTISGGAARRSGKATAGRADAVPQKSRCSISQDIARPGYAEETGGPVRSDGQGQADLEEYSSATPGEVAGGRRIVDDNGMVDDRPSPQRTMLLLQETSGEADDGSCDTDQQGGTPRGGQRRASMRELQQPEAGQIDPSVLIDCPGCAKCKKRGGYVLKMSAGRTTRSHEYVFLLTKSESYFHDSIAIEEDGDIPVGTRAAKGSAARSDLKHVNGRPSEYYEYTGKRNKRSVWHIATQPFPEAHFATFPPDLVEPCILAGTSERGCCSTCGAPWARVTEKLDTGRRQKMADGWDTDAGSHGTIHRSGREKGKTGVPVMADITTGWRPSCSCGAAVVPCTVLDPFGGAGTVGLVADRLGRDAVLIELNLEYAEIARRRLEKDAGMFAEVKS